MSNGSDKTPLESVLAEARWLRGLALCLARDRAEAEDLVQETWMAARRASPEPRASLRPWLAQVLRNLRRQGLRGSTRRRARETGAALLQKGEVAACTESLLARLELQRLVSEMVQDREKILRANAIFSSAGLEAPFTTEALRCLPPITIHRALTSLREAGVTDEAAGSVSE